MSDLVGNPEDRFSRVEAHLLLQCQKGSKVSLRVGGDFCFQAEITRVKPDLLLIAGGIGITPLFSIWQHCRDLNVASSDYSDVFGRLLLLYSVSTRDELIFNVSMSCDARKQVVGISDQV